MKQVPDDVIDLKLLTKMLTDNTKKLTDNNKKLTDIAENHENRITDLEREATILRPLQDVVDPLVEMVLRKRRKKEQKAARKQQAKEQEERAKVSSSPSSECDHFINGSPHKGDYANGLSAARLKKSSEARRQSFSASATAAAGGGAGAGAGTGRMSDMSDKSSIKPTNLLELEMSMINSPADTADLLVSPRVIIEDDIDETIGMLQNLHL